MPRRPRVATRSAGRSRPPSRRTWEFLACALAAGLWISPASSLPQSAAGGAVAGHVRGPGGVSVPGATLVLTEKQSGERKETWSDEAGNYTFADLLPGIYKLEVSLVGFQADVRDPVPVGAGKSLKVDIALVLLPPDATATPAALRRPGDLESLSPESREKLHNVAAQGGASGGWPMGSDTAGAGGGGAEVRFSEGAATSEAPQGDSGSTEGGDAGQGDSQAGANNSFLLSGNLGRAATPGDDEGQGRRRMQEFRRSQQSQGAPGFGGGGGFEGVMMFGGGWAGRRPQVNRIRGNISEEYSNSLFNAHPYPLNVGSSPRIPSYQEQAGFAVGGPLVIPYIYNGKKKTSFFVHYNLKRGRNPVDSFATVPTLDERGGDFSKTVIPSGPLAGTVPTIYIPGSNPLTAFPGNRIPVPSFDKAAVALLNYIPLPNPNLPGSVQNFHLQEALPTASDRAMGRIGHQISDKDSLNVFYFFNSTRSQNVGNFPGLKQFGSARSQNLNFGETHTFNPHYMNSFMFNLNRMRNSNLNSFAFNQDIARTLGIQDVSQDPRDWGLPILGFTNFTGLNDLIPSLIRNQTLRAVDFAILNFGKHNLRIGGEVRRVQLNQLTDPDARGTFTFTGFTTSNFTPQGFAVPGTGYDFADFLLGLPETTSVRFGTSSNYFRSWVFSGFAQDDWRASSRLTFNLGLRYEFEMPFAEKNGHLSDLAIGPGFSTIGVVTGQTPGILPTSLIRSDTNNVAPRLGLAFRPWAKRKFVLRSGYGIFYDSSIYQRLVPNLANQPPFAKASTLLTNLTAPTQTLTLEKGFPTLAPTIASNTYAVDPNFRTPYGQSWSLGVENEIARDFILSLGYAGTKGTKLDLLLGPNRAVSAQKGLTLPNAQEFTYETSGAASIYQGLQVGLRRQFHGGFSFSADFTFSKSIDDAASVGGAGRTVAQNSLDLKAERGLSGFDLRHRLILDYSYELPFGRRKRYLNHGGPAGWALADWEISGVGTLRSGTPFTARVLGNQSNNSGTGSYFSERADATGGSVGLPTSNQNTLRYFNTSAFTLPAAGMFGNAGRNTIPGPRTINFNMSLGRFITLNQEKGIRLSFRLEANNIFNTPSFTNLGTVVDAANFGRVTGVSSMRSLTLSMRLRF